MRVVKYPRTMRLTPIPSIPRFLPSDRQLFFGGFDDRLAEFVAKAMDAVLRYDVQKAPGGGGWIFPKRHSKTIEYISTKIDLSIRDGSKVFIVFWKM